MEVVDIAGGGGLEIGGRDSVARRVSSLFLCSTTRSGISVNQGAVQQCGLGFRASGLVIL